MTSLPILTFHSLDERPSPISFPPELFRTGMQRLHRQGYRTLTVAEAALCLQRNHPWPERSLVVTFDDGYESVFTRVFPVLKELGYRATVFLTAAGDRSEVLASMEGRPRLSWDQVREMHSAGFEIGAHTMTHPDLTRVGVRQAEDEAAGSRAVIEDRIGAPVASFAYPYGFHNPAVREVVGRHFECACAGELGLVTASSDPLALERVEMHYFRNQVTFGLLGGPMLPVYLALRRGPRLVRQWVARSMSRSHLAA